MTRRFTGFDDWDVSTIGTNEPGWSVRGGGAPTFKPAYAAEGVVPRGERYCEFLTDSTADYRFISNDAIDADANRATFSIVAGFTMDLTTTEEIHLYARAVSTTDFLRARIVKASGNVYIDKMVAGAYTAGSGASAGNVTLTAGHSYVVRFDGNAGAVNLKVWDAALGTRAEFGFSGEPAAYNLTPTGMTPTAAGWLGFGGRHSTLTGKIVALNFFASGTNGDAAVCPITDAEYNAWLAEQSVRRVITMTLRATGYDSSGAPYTKKIKAQMSNAGYNAHEQDGLANQHFQAIIAQVPDFNVELPGAFSGAGSVSIGELVVRNPRGPKKRYVNYALQSCAFDTAPWGGTATVTTGSATPPTGCTRADTLTDASAVAYSNRAQSVTVPNDTATWYIAIRVKKTTGGTAKTFAMNINLTGGTTVAVFPRVNTDTGAIQNPGNVGVQETEDGQYWLVTWAIVNNGTGNVTLTVDIFPAVATWPGADSAAITGSAIVSGLQVWREAGALYANTTTAAANFTKAGGIRDDWLRYAWDRDPAVMRLGDPAKPWHDHRVILRGRVGMPTAPSLSRIAFKMADLSDILNTPLSTRFTAAGPYKDQFKPKLFGFINGQIEPPRTGNGGALDFTIDDGPLNLVTADSLGGTWIFAYNNSVPIDAPSGLTIAAVNAGTDTLTASAAHGMVPNYRVTFPVDINLPAGLSANTDYFVIAAGLTATDFRLSTTLGGGAVNITGTTTGTAIRGFGYYFPNAGADGVMTLVNDPGDGNRITVYGAQDSTSAASEWNPANIYAEILFGAGALSANYKYQASFDAYADAMAPGGGSTDFAGLWFDTRAHSVREAADAHAEGTLSWYTPTPDGRFQVGMLGLPAATASATITEGEIAAGSMQLADVIRPVDFSQAEISASPWFVTGGPLAGTAPAGLQLKSFIAPLSYGASAPPLENYPAVFDANKNARYELTLSINNAANTLANLRALYRWKLGTFALQTRLRAVMFKLGATVRVQHGRLGWEIYNAGNPASPDNTATLDSELAVIVGKRFQFKKPHPIELKLLRPIHAKFPTTDITADS